MTSIRSLALFNGDPCVVMWLVGTATVTTQALTATSDTANEEWGLLSGQNRGLRLGHQRGLFHGHGHDQTPAKRLPWTARPGLPARNGQAGHPEARLVPRPPALGLYMRTCV